MQQEQAKRRPEALRGTGEVLLYCPYPVLVPGLSEAFFGAATFSFDGPLPPLDDPPGCVVVCVTDAEEARERVGLARDGFGDGVPVVAFGLASSLDIVRASLRAGARGFVCGEMTADQILRAVRFAAKGEVVVPRDLVPDLIAEDQSANLEGLTDRQAEVLRLVTEGFTNARIEAQLYLSESTVKQHLRAAFKTLGVSNRTEAARLVRGKV